MKLNEFWLFWPCNWNTSVKLSILFFMVLFLIIMNLVSIFYFENLNFYFLIALLCIFYVHRFIYDQDLKFYPGTLHYDVDSFDNQVIRFGVFVIFLVLYVLCAVL
ncbi:hypothetical protein A1QC_15275 [Vibrio rumoiensis 1S-45]|uniref:Uncharacterized protein n=1 Tax=Vibrio rumoiensis 1S-45 TaxID=1188252 RepID=A0A1E5E3F8_9VIBR|nr:hypothetical protein A1QC_15275 [Vibrio rumoiensis 1S-45]